MLVVDIRNEGIDLSLKHSMIEIHKELCLDFQTSVTIFTKLSSMNQGILFDSYCELLLTVKEHMRDVTYTWKC